MKGSSFVNYNSLKKILQTQISLKSHDHFNCVLILAPLLYIQLNNVVIN